MVVEFAKEVLYAPLFISKQGLKNIVTTTHSQSDIMLWFNFLISSVEEEEEEKEERDWWK